MIFFSLFRDACRKIYTGVRWQKSSACHNLLLIPFWLRVTSRVVRFSKKPKPVEVKPPNFTNYSLGEKEQKEVLYYDDDHLLIN